MAVRAGIRWMYVFRAAITFTTKTCRVFLVVFNPSAHQKSNVPVRRTGKRQTIIKTLWCAAREKGKNQDEKDYGKMIINLSISACFMSERVRGYQKKNCIYDKKKRSFLENKADGWKEFVCLAGVIDRMDWMLTI